MFMREPPCLHHRRSCADRVVPAPHVGKCSQINAMPFVPGDPRIDRHVGDRVFLCEETCARQVPVHDAVQAFRLVAVAFAAVGNLVLLRAHKVVRLAEHRADAAHLKHEPLQRLVLPAHAFRQELARLAGEVNQDRPDSIMAMGLPSGPSGSTMPGIFPLGLIFRYSGANCSVFVPMLILCTL